VSQTTLLKLVSNGLPTVIDFFTTWCAACPSAAKKIEGLASGKYAGAQVQPLQCIQEEGEVAFVPARWGHGVINLQPSIGL